VIARLSRNSVITTLSQTRVAVNAQNAASAAAAGRDARPGNQLEEGRNGLSTAQL
jgi:hypothetical protein